MSATKKYDPLVVNGPTGVCLLYSAGHFRGQATGGFARLVFFFATNFIGQFFYLYMA